MVEERRGFRAQLYTRPRVELFGRHQEDKLEAYLQLLDARTDVQPLSTIAELQLLPDGTTCQGGYRFTYQGFKQMTWILAKGLTVLLPDLSGMTIRRETTDAHIDSEVAIDTLNRILKLRETLFWPYRLVRNHQEKLIEGLVGSKHMFLENLQLYQQAQEAIFAHQISATFHGAIMTGRRLGIWFRKKEQLFRVALPDGTFPFYHGYYFANGEAAGTSVRGTSCLFTREGVCILPYARYGGRAKHVGNDFYQRLGQLYTTVMTSELPVADLTAKAKALLDVPLGIDAVEGKKRHNQERRWVHGLSQVGIPGGMAIEALDDALFRGHQAKEPLTSYQLETVVKTRTAFDLFVSMLRVARGLGIDRRERLEQAAYSLLTGKLLG